MINNGFGDNLTESVLDIYDCRGYYDRPRQGFADEVIQNDSFQTSSQTTSEAQEKTKF